MKLIEELQLSPEEIQAVVDKYTKPPDEDIPEWTVQAWEVYQELIGEVIQKVLSNLRILIKADDQTVPTCDIPSISTSGRWTTQEIRHNKMVSLLHQLYDEVVADMLNDNWVKTVPKDKVLEAKDGR